MAKKIPLSQLKEVASDAHTLVFLQKHNTNGKILSDPEGEDKTSQ